MKPEVIMLMASSLDGRLHPSRWTSSPDGGRQEWSALFEKTHDALKGDAWIVGRVTMAEMSRVTAHPPTVAGSPERPLHAATRDVKQYAIAIDQSGWLHFAGGTLS